MYMYPVTYRRGDVGDEPIWRWIGRQSDTRRKAYEGERPHKRCHSSARRQSQSLASIREDRSSWPASLTCTI